MTNSLAFEEFRVSTLNSTFLSLVIYHNYQRKELTSYERGYIKSIKDFYNFPSCLSEAEKEIEKPLENGYYSIKDFVHWIDLEKISDSIYLFREDIELFENESYVKAVTFSNDYIEIQKEKTAFSEYATIETIDGRRYTIYLFPDDATVTDLFDYLLDVCY